MPGYVPLGLRLRNTYARGMRRPLAPASNQAAQSHVEYLMGLMESHQYDRKAQKNTGRIQIQISVAIYCLNRLLWIWKFQNISLRWSRHDHGHWALGSRH